MAVSIGIADDQQLFVKALGALIGTFAGFRMSMDALSGEEILKKLETATDLPDIILLDVKMPVMGGIKTAEIIAQKYPEIKLAALSQENDDTVIIAMLKAGCCAYLLKRLNEVNLEKALLQIHTEGYYNASAEVFNARRLILHSQKKEEVRPTEKELRFLQLACSDLTYKQIAAKMGLKPRTVDDYRAALFEKLEVESRVGMVLAAIHKNLVSLSDIPYH